MSSAFATKARQQVRTALELAVQRTPENTSRVAAELSSLSAEATALGLNSIAELARRGCEQAKLLDRDSAARTVLSRTLRELGRALEALPEKHGRVLVVDDSSLNAVVICDALENAAFETQYAEDAETAVTLVYRFLPDVVLADVHMPDSTPAKLCARMRAAAGARALHVILFSGLPDEELSKLARDAGADGFLSKERGLKAVVEEVTNACRSIAQ